MILILYNIYRGVSTTYYMLHVVYDILYIAHYYISFIVYYTLCVVYMICAISYTISASYILSLMYDNDICMYIYIHLYVISFHVLS